MLKLHTTELHAMEIRLMMGERILCFYFPCDDIFLRGPYFFPMPRWLLSPADTKIATELHGLMTALMVLVGYFVFA